MTKIVCSTRADPSGWSFHSSVSTVAWIGQFVVKPLDQLLAGDLGGERTDRRLRDLILRIEPGTGRDHRGEAIKELRQAVAGRGADHEGLLEGERCVEPGRKLKQLRPFDEVDLVEDSEPWLAGLADRAQDRLRVLGQARLIDLLAGVDQEHEKVSVGRGAPGGRRPSPGRGGA